MNATDIAAIIGSIAGLLLAIPAFFALLQYRSNSRAQRAQWLVGLFERFYEKDSYREVRRHVEWQEEEVRSKISEDPDFEQKWTDYLNFFEFIAYLEGIGELKSQDVDAMFRYWIDDLRRFDGYLREFGYENLVQLLRRHSSERVTK